MKKLSFLLLTLLSAAEPWRIFDIPCVQAAGPNTISYQGRLRESGQPVSGIRSIQFRLFDASSAGTEVFNSGVQAIYVSSGIFGYQLGGQNFKDLSWATSSYWLEISVGGNAMSPREQINAMPYAFMSSTAASLNGGGNIQVTGAGPHYINNGNVGIGVTNPAGWFQIGPGTFTVLNSGNVGIGTTNPQYNFEVTGNTNIIVSSSNAAGSFLKFIDGTMIQYAKYTITDSLSVSNNSSASYQVWANSFNLTLPASFIDTNYIITTNLRIATSNFIGHAACIPQTVNTFWAREQWNYNYSASTRYLEIIAIGRWK